MKNIELAAAVFIYGTAIVMTAWTFVFVWRNRRAKKEN